jgi:hypothetical protein
MNWAAAGKPLACNPWRPPQTKYIAAQQIKATSYTATHASLYLGALLPAECCNILQGPVFALLADEGASQQQIILGDSEEALAPVCRHACKDASKMWQLRSTEQFKHQEPLVIKPAAHHRLVQGRHAPGRSFHKGFACP